MNLQFILCALLVLFFIGLKDDIIPISPLKKLLSQVVASFILIHFAEVRLTSFYGIFGLYEISLEASYCLSFMTIITIINAFNLIDGVDTLACSIGIIISLTFGLWFYAVGSLENAIIASSLFGSLVGVFIYNKSPARVFMGDTGSLMLGLLSSVLAIRFIELARTYVTENHPLAINSGPAVAFGILIIPLFDTLRVFLLRIIGGRSPFSADQEHLHHVLLSITNSHMRTSLILSLVNIAFVIFVVTFQDVRGDLLLSYVLGISFVLTWLLVKWRNRKILQITKDMEQQTTLKTTIENEKHQFDDLH